jgi:hypothetical protein
VKTSQAGILLVVLLCAQPLLAEDTAEIVTRCIFDIGEFGSEAVDMCVKQDLAAAKALKDYPPEAAPVIANCTERMKSGGWVMVKRCVDRTLAGAADKGRE